MGTNAGDTIIAPATSLDPIEVDNQNDLVTQTNTSFAPGSSTCGTAFTAPDSGKVYVTISAHLQGNASGSLGYVSYEARTGNVVGSGTVIQPAVTDRGVAVGGTATGLTVARGSLSRRTLLTGLTPGTDYNLWTLHELVGTGSISIFSRELLIEMVH